MKHWTALRLSLTPVKQKEVFPPVSAHPQLKRNHIIQQTCPSLFWPQWDWTPWRWIKERRGGNRCYYTTRASTTMFSARRGSHFGVKGIKERRRSSLNRDFSCERDDMFFPNKSDWFGELKRQKERRRKEAGMRSKAVAMAVEFYFWTRIKYKKKKTKGEEEFSL